MELDLAGRIAIVTGASKGIGLAIARGLMASGAHVVAGARESSAELEELAQSGQAQIALVDLAGAEGRLRWSHRPVTRLTSSSTMSAAPQPGPGAS